MRAGLKVQRRSASAKKPRPARRTRTDAPDPPARDPQAWLLALAFGAFVGAAHFPVPAGPVCLIGFIALSRLLDPRRSAVGVGWPLFLGSTLYYVCLNTWYRALWPVLGIYAWIFYGLTALVLAATLVPFILAARRLERVWNVPRWAALPLLWTSHEAIEPFLGYSFGKTAQAFINHPSWIQFIDATGLHGVGLVAVFLSCVVDEVVFGRAPGRRRMAVGALGVILVAGLAIDGRRKERFWSDRQARPIGSVEVVATDFQERPDWPRWLKVVREASSKVGPNGAPKLLALPECVLPDVLECSATRVEEIGEGRVGPAIATGAWLEGRSPSGATRSFNTVLLLDSSGAILERYEKQRLAPLGETPGLFRYLPGFQRFAPSLNEFTAGDGGSVFTVGPLRVGVVICWEIVFPDLVVAARQRGAALIVNPCADNLFQGSTAPHFPAAVLRAIELRTTVLRPANAGPTLAIDPMGHCHRLPANQFGSLTVPIAAAGPEPFASRHYEQLQITAIVVGPLLLIGSWHAGRQPVGASAPSAT